MALVVSLAEAKAHLRITDTSEDTILQLYINAAHDYIANYLNNANFQDAPSIKAAALLLIGDLFENREAQSDRVLNENKAVVRLLYPYRQQLGV